MMEGTEQDGPNGSRPEPIGGEGLARGPTGPLWGGGAASCIPSSLEPQIGQFFLPALHTDGSHVHQDQSINAAAAVRLSKID